MDGCVTFILKYLKGAKARVSTINWDDKSRPTTMHLRLFASLFHLNYTGQYMFRNKVDARGENSQRNDLNTTDIKPMNSLVVKGTNCPFSYKMIKQGPNRRQLHQNINIAHGEEARSYTKRRVFN
jgi:plasmid rolling circle replication initiator protein Rep